jgi:hypothetical protein
VSDRLTDPDGQGAEPEPEPLTATVAGSDADRQDAAGEWLDSRSAMLRLGIAERTLHRRVARGELRKRSRADGRLEVWVPSVEHRRASDAVTDPDRQAEQAERALALVERVNLAVGQQVAPLLDLVERQQGTIREQAEELGRLRQRLADLEARPDPAPPDSATVDVSPPPRPWWRFW